MAAAGIQTADAKCVSSGAATVAVLGCILLTHGGWWLECRGFPGPDAPSPGVAVLRQDGGDLGHATKHVYCASLERFQRSGPNRCKEELAFQSFTVGWIAYNRSCGYRKCSVELHILKSVAELKPFSYSSSDDAFWDFTSPMFGARGGSLRWLYFNNAPENIDKIACKISLVNIYHLANTSIENFFLSHNWNKSTYLKLGAMSKLKSFTLISTSLQNFPNDASTVMPVLEELILRDNQMLQPLAVALSGMHHLQTLDLSGCRMGRPSGWLPPLPQLRKLVLRGAGLCCLQEEQETAFHNVLGLRKLDISHNGLPALGTALRELHWLTTLDASHNLLTQYPHLQLHGSIALNLESITLDFAHNRLRTVPHCSHLGSDNHILSIDLTGNQISSWEGSADMLRCVSELNLTYNEMSTLSPGMLDSLGSLVVVDIGANPLDCSGCPLLHLRDWLLKTNTQVLSLGPQGLGGVLTCKQPPGLAGLAVEMAPVNPNACMQPITSRWPLALGLGLSLAAVATLMLSAASCYRHRFEIAYTIHLLRLRTRARRSRLQAATTSAEHFLFDAFILYSGSDRAWVVGRLVPLLENGPQRYRICLHERDFQLGTVIVQNISHSMDRSRHTIVVLSKEFLASRWCLWEMDLANHRTLDPSQRDFIILLELEPLERTALPRHLRFLMDTRTYLQWHQEGTPHQEEQALRRLKRALGPASPFVPRDTHTHITENKVYVS